MWVTRVNFNKSLSEFPVHQQALIALLWDLFQAGDGRDAVSITEEHADISIRSRGRERQWFTIDLAKSYLIFLKNRFDDNTDGLIFNGTLEEQLQSDNPDDPEIIENPVKLETYQSTPKQV